MVQKQLQKTLPLLLGLVFLVLTTTPLKADVLYEGWHKVLSAGQHIGYFVLQYKLDDKTKKFSMTSFLKTNAAGNNVTEALQAESLQLTNPKQWVLPVKYKYTYKEGKKFKTIDASFKEEKAPITAGGPKGTSSKQEKILRMKAEVNEDGKKKKVDLKLGPNTFLSSFLIHIILQSKEGLKIGSSYSYTAIAEEDAQPYDGYANVKEIEKINGKDAFKVINEFKKIRFISLLTAKGEILGTKSPLLSIASEESTKDIATKGIGVDIQTIKTLFGEIP